MFFSTSQRSVKKKRELKKFHGILADPNKREGRCLSDDIKERVVECYLSDEYSACVQGKKNSYQ